MVHHIVWWTLKAQAEGATAHENALKLQAMLLNLRALDCVQQMDVVVTLLPTSSENADIMLQSTHSDARALKEYAEHSDHMEVADFCRKIVASRKSLDYAV